MRGDPVKPESSQAGFSLIETVAALGILALAALPLMQLTGQAVRNTAFLENRFLARTVAENIMARTIAEPDPLEAGIEVGQESQMARQFAWTRLTSAVDATGLQTIEVTVARTEDSQILARLISFRAAQGILPAVEPEPQTDERSQR